MNKEVLNVENLKCNFIQENKLFKKNIYLKAIDDISFKINKGITLGIVGESGCGKSTLCRTILSLNKKENVSNRKKPCFTVFRADNLV